jgi:hypothetical protein
MNPHFLQEIAADLFRLIGSHLSDFDRCQGHIIKGGQLVGKKLQHEIDRQIKDRRCKESLGRHEALGCHQLPCAR